MARYRIICTRQKPFNQPHNHAHIVEAGTGTTAKHYDKIWTVQEIYSAMDRGDTFYTYGETTGKTAEVHKYTCTHSACQFKTIRSSPDAVQDNNLDNLPTCN